MTFNSYSITTWINITICNFGFSCHPYFLVTIYEEFLTINSDCDKEKKSNTTFKAQKESLLERLKSLNCNILQYNRAILKIHLKIVNNISDNKIKAISANNVF